MTSPGRPHAAGFTLIEMMVTVAIAVILMVIAVPNFLAFQRSSAVFAASSSFAAALNYAKAEAIKRSQSTYVVPVADNDWSSGWRVFVDVSGAGDFAAATNEGVLTQAPLPSDVTVDAAADLSKAFGDGSRRYVRYDGSGIPGTRPAGSAMTLPNSVDFNAAGGGATTTRRVILGVVGRPRICDPVKDSVGCQTSVD